jgi:hypothetical protein
LSDCSGKTFLKLLGELIDRLTLAAPNDDAEHHESKNSRDDPDCSCVHFSLLFRFIQPPFLPAAGKIKFT